MDGFLVINKEKNYTSHDICQIVKKTLKADKCGHTGTLDPNTTGVLVVGVNKATKLMSLLNDHDKEYATTIVLGLQTDTLDIMGKVIKTETDLNITINEVAEAILKLRKQTIQIPPIYSSIKVDGKKLYEYAREEKEVHIKPREIKVYDIKILNGPYEEDGLIYVDIYLHVGRGYYVRSFARDLAEELNTVGTMKELTRLRSGQFSIEGSISLDDLQNNNFTIISIETLFKHIGRLDVNDYLAKLVMNGVYLDERQIITEDPFLVYNNNKLIAIYEVITKNKYKPLLILS